MSSEQASSANTTAAAKMTEEEIIQQYNMLRQEQNTIMSRVAELESESYIHGLVAEELRPLNADRCCHRLVGNALVKRTVGDVLPEIEANLQAIREAIDSLHKTLQQKEEAMQEFMLKHQLTRPGQEQKIQAGNDGTDGSARGVLA